MKTILATIIALTCFVSAQEPATGDYVFRKKAVRGYESVTLTPENGKVIGWTSGNLANVVGGGGGSSAWGDITGKPVAVTSLTGTNTGDQSAASLGLVIGTNVQAYNANLTSWAGITPVTKADASALSGYLTTATAADTYAPIATTLTLDGVQTITGHKTFFNTPLTLNAAPLDISSTAVTFNSGGARFESGSYSRFLSGSEIDFSDGSIFTYTPTAATDHRTALAGGSTSTGTGGLVRAISPTFTGTLTAQAISGTTGTFSGAVSGLSFTNTTGSFLVNSTGAVTSGKSGTQGAVSVTNSTGGSIIQISGSSTYGYHMGSGTCISWGNVATLNGNQTSNISQISQGLLGVGSGTTSVAQGATNGGMKMTKLILTPAASVTPALNGEMEFEATSNTSVTIKLKGTDGTVRSVVLTLAP